MRKNWSRLSGVFGLLASFGLIVGCIGVTDVFDESFIDTLTGTGQVASLPNNAPSILLTVDNRTDRVASIDVTYRNADGVAERIPVTLQANSQLAKAVPCPIEEMTVGEITDLTAPGAYVSLGSGGDQDPFVAVEAYGVLLRDGVSYACGDGVTFALVTSSATASGFRIVAYVEQN